MLPHLKLIYIACMPGLRVSACGLSQICAAALQVSDLRIVLKVVRTVLRCFHRQLRAKAGVFVEGLIAGAPRSACCLNRLDKRLTYPGVSCGPSQISCGA